MDRSQQTCTVPLVTPAIPFYEIACQIGINMTGRLGYCDGSAENKSMRKTIAQPTSCRAEKRLQRLYVDLAGPIPTSTGGSRYCLNSSLTLSTCVGRCFSRTSARPPSLSVSSLFWRPLMSRGCRNAFARTTPPNSLTPSFKGRWSTTTSVSGSRPSTA